MLLVLLLHLLLLFLLLLLFILSVIVVEVGIVVFWLALIGLVGVLLWPKIHCPILELCICWAPVHSDLLVCALIVERKFSSLRGCSDRLKVEWEVG